MKSILLVFFMTLMISMIMFMLTMMISKKSILDLQKSSPFECGFNPLSIKRLPFSINFFMVAIIFLIFDIEIIILLPSLLSMKMCLMKFWFTSILLFFVILIVGLYYEWMNGLLNWKN